MDFISFCPQCGEEELEVTVTGGGNADHPDFGPYTWITGVAACRVCGFMTNDYSDCSI